MNTAVKEVQVIKATKTGEKNRKNQSGGILQSQYR